MRRLLSLARQADDGFTLFEALLAIALMGLILGAIGTVTAQWLPTWNRGLVRAQHNEQVAVALDRMVADLSAAEYVSLTQTKNVPLFIGTESGVMFVRPVLGPNSHPGLEIVRIAETADSLGAALVRTRAPFVILPNGNPLTDQVSFRDPVVLLRAPLRVTFSYAGPDGKWASGWRSSGALPTSVRFDVRDVERGTVVSTAAKIHVDMNPPRPDPAALANADNAQAKAGDGQSSGGQSK